MLQQITLFSLRWTKTTVTTPSRHPYVFFMLYRNNVDIRWANDYVVPLELAGLSDSNAPRFLNDKHHQMHQISLSTRVNFKLIYKKIVQNRGKITACKINFKWPILCCKIVVKFCKIYYTGSYFPPGPKPQKLASRMSKNRIKTNNSRPIKNSSHLRPNFIIKD